MGERIDDRLRIGKLDDQLVHVDAADYLHGCVRVVEEPGGWRRPWRFTAEQVRTMGSCQAWHPGLYRQMARTTAGVTIEFDTDATEVSVELLLDAEPSGTRSVLDPIRGEEDLPLDGISVDVDARHLPCYMPSTGESLVQLSLDDPTRAPSPGMVMLPGLGEKRRVRIWLPALRGCAVRQLWGNGSFFEPVERHEQLLVIGDSVAQGFVTGDPALAWPSLLATFLGIDVVNQGLGGQVFQPSSLVGLSAYVNPSCIVVALGENYRYEPCRHRPTARDVRNHLVEVARLWPDVPTYVCTPLWHDEELSPSHRMSCWRRVPSMIEANAAVHDEMVLVDGLRVVDHDPSSFSDVHGHLNAVGAAQVARYLELIMCHVSLDEPMLRERAMKLLADAPRQSLPIVEMLRLGMGKVVYAEEGCVLLRLDDRLVVSVSDQDAAAAAIAMLSDDALCFVDDRSFGERLSRTLGLADMTPISVALYRRKVKPRISPEQRPVALGREYLAEVQALCANVPWATDEVLGRAMTQEALLGVFAEEELVGLIAELPDGSLTIPVIREGHAGEGWERALIAAQVIRLQGRGRLPWLLVQRDDEELLRTLRSVGMSVGSTDECCLLSKPAASDEEPVTY